MDFSTKERAAREKVTFKEFNEKIKNYVNKTFKNHGDIVFEIM